MTREKYKFGENDLFVMYSMPGSKEVSLYLHDESATTFEFVIHPFIRHKVPTTILKSDTVIANPEVEFVTHKTCLLKSTTKANYMAQAERLKRSIDRGVFQKAILSRIKVEPLEKPDYAEIYHQLVDQYPKAFCYFFNVPGQGTWIGASPEVLLESKSTGFSTVALAGTQAVPETPHDRIEWTDKEIKEQGIIVDYVASKLYEMNIAYELTGPRTSKAGNVYHLKSVFSSSQKVDPVELALSLHPGPAISGYPIEDALLFIKTTETHNREYYCGFLGPNNTSNTQLFINLRCMQVFSDAVALYAGGGYTAASVPGDEWKETELKSKTLLQVIEDAYITADGI